LREFGCKKFEENLRKFCKKILQENPARKSIKNLTKIPMENAQKLHHEFIRLGSMRHKLKNRMLAILPEIYKSGIYKKYAGSIVEYAGKFGDIAKTTVMKRLRLEKNLEDKPFLKAVIEKVGVHKVALVAKIATAETDKIFAEKVENMSRVAVQSLSKELRARGERIGGGGLNKAYWAAENGSGQLNFEGYVSGESLEQVNLDSNHGQLCRAVPRTAKIELDEESTFFLMKLKAKLGKHLSDKEFLKLVLKDRVEQEFVEKFKKSEKKTDEKITDQNRGMKPEKFGKETAEESANQVANQEANQWAVELEMALCSEKVIQKNVIDDTFGSENHHPQDSVKVTEIGNPSKNHPLHSSLQKTPNHHPNKRKMFLSELQFSVPKRKPEYKTMGAGGG
jgi:hypothetical protein